MCWPLPVFSRAMTASSDAPGCHEGRAEADNAGALRAPAACPVSPVMAMKPDMACITGS